MNKKEIKLKNKRELMILRDLILIGLEKEKSYTFKEPTYKFLENIILKLDDYNLDYVDKLFQNAAKEKFYSIKKKDLKIN